MPALFFFLFFYIEIQLINNVRVSGVQQSDSVLHIHVSVIFQILFPFRLLQYIKQSPLCYIVGPYWLSILFIYLFLDFLFCIGGIGINNVVIVSSEQWRDSVIHMHVSILPQTFLPSMLLHSSMCYTVGLVDYSF